MDDLVPLQIFARAAELHSFSKAAASLGVKTSTVSRHIRQLEQRLGIALFNRSTRSLALTEGGRTLWMQLAPALQAIEQACSRTSALNQQAQGHLRVTAPTAFGRDRLLPRLPEFLARYPQISVELVLDDAISHLIDQHLDLAIRIAPVADPSLQGRQIAAQPSLLVASPSYLEQHPAPQRPEELSQHQCLTLPGTSHWYFVPAQQALMSALQVAVQGRLHCNDLSALQQLALAGQGLALLPQWQVAEDCRRGRLRPLLDSWQIGPHPQPVWIWALYPPKATVSSKVRAFIDFYLEALHSGPSAEPSATQN